VHGNADTLEPVGRGEAAIDLLSRGLAGERADLDAGAHSPICDEVIVPRPHARVEQVYCSAVCRKTAAARRELVEVAA
jgi:hypothetical protein